MSWSNVTIITTAQSLPASTNTSFNSSSIETQRMVDENGIVQANFSVYPGASTGKIVAQGRLSKDAPFSDIHIGGVQVKVNFTDVTLGLTFFNAIGIINLPMLPEMRIRGEDMNPTNACTVDVRIME